MKAICSSKTSVLTRATRRNIPEDGILHRDRHENLKSDMYVVQTSRGLVMQTTGENSYYDGSDCNTMQFDRLG
jgi:hypothetical protein